MSVEYNAENASGFIKSWDNAYMQTMLHSNGTYPNQYTREYAGQLLEKQEAGEIDALSGASSSCGFGGCVCRYDGVKGGISPPLFLYFML